MSPLHRFVATVRCEQGGAPKSVGMALPSGSMAPSEVTVRE